MHRPGSSYGALNGCLPWWPQWLFKTNLLNEGWPVIEYWITTVLTRIPHNMHNFNPGVKFEQVRIALAACALQVARVWNIRICAQIIRVITTSRQSGVRQNKQWIINSQIDLAAWKNVDNLKLKHPFWAQVEGTGREIITEPPITLQSRCKHVPTEPILTYGHSWPQCKSVHLE